jgi:hypothetical protein
MLKNLKRVGIALISISLFLNACKKPNRANTEIQVIEKNTPKKFTPEKVDEELLKTYMDYQIKVESNYLLRNSGKQISFSYANMKPHEFDLMISNFLANERNYLLQKNQTSTFKSRWVDGGEEYPETDGPESGSPFTYTCRFPGNSITSVLFTGNISTGGHIGVHTFGFSGVHGTINTFGNFIQSIHNGVTTYQQQFCESISVNGVGFYQYFIVFGNIYNGNGTMNVLPLPNTTTGP